MAVRSTDGIAAIPRGLRRPGARINGRSGIGTSQYDRPLHRRLDLGHPQPEDGASYHELRFRELRFRGPDNYVVGINETG